MINIHRKRKPTDIKNIYTFASKYNAMKKMSNNEILDKVCERHSLLNNLKHTIGEAAEIIIKSYSTGGKLLVCGNGGSSSDSDHIVGELMKSFEQFRPVKNEIAEELTKTYGERGKYLSEKLEQGLPAIALTAQTALITAVSNDIDGNLIFAQQVIGYGKDKDILLAISSSGNSQNVVDACITAKAIGMKVIGLTGITGGKMKEFCDLLINVPEKRTASVQELHLPVYHTICLLIENHFFGNFKY